MMEKFDFICDNTGGDSIEGEWLFELLVMLSEALGLNSNLKRSLDVVIQLLRDTYEISNKYLNWYSTHLGSIVGMLLHRPIGDYEVHQLAYAESIKISTTLKNYLKSLYKPPSTSLPTASQLEELDRLFKSALIPNAWLAFYPAKQEVIKARENLMLVLETLSKDHYIQAQNQKIQALEQDNQKWKTSFLTLQDQVKAFAVHAHDRSTPLQSQEKPVQAKNVVSKIQFSNKLNELKKKFKKEVRTKSDRFFKKNNTELHSVPTSTQQVQHST